MNLSLDSGNTPRSFRLFRLAEHSTPDRSFESCSRFIDIGSINGFHLHKLCRSVSETDAKEYQQRTQAPERIISAEVLKRAVDCLAVSRETRNEKRETG